MKKSGKIKVPKRNIHRRVAKGDISRSLSVMKENERRVLRKLH